MLEKEESTQGVCPFHRSGGGMFNAGGWQENLTAPESALLAKSPMSSLSNGLKK